MGHFKWFLANLCLVIPALSLDYPEAYRNTSVVDDYHGTRVNDPYRWLEDPSSEQTVAFVEAQNNLTDSYVQSCPERDAIRQKFTEMWNYRKIEPLSKHGDYYYYFANTGLQNQNVLYRKQTLDGQPQVFLDPNEMSPNGSISMSYANKFSNNGKIYAFSLSESGSDWMRIRFRNTETGQDYPETLYKARFTMAVWSGDDQGIFYGAYPHLEEGDTGVVDNQKVFYHRIGTNQSEDILVAEFPDKPHWQLAIPLDVTRDGKYMILTPTGDGTFFDTAVLVARIPDNITTKFTWTTIIPDFTAQYRYAASSGSIIYFKTNKNAPNNKIVAIDVSNPVESQWKTIAPEDLHKVIDWAVLANKDKLVIGYLEDVKHKVSVRNATDGSVLVENYPLDIGTVVTDTFMQTDSDDSLFFFKFESFLIPSRIYMVNFTQDVHSLEIYDDVVLEGLDANNFITEQVFYPSKDGTSIPMFITHKKNLPQNGQSFTFLYAYGGFSVPSTSHFSVMYAVFMQSFNGVVAVANIRGGGEYGEAWHQNGTMDKKQNSFDDFQAAGEYLIRMNYTSKSKLIINGESNGGLLVTACLTQRPDLFAAAIPQVPLTDMLRYHKFTIGYLWIMEYGSADNPSQFEYIYKYSPLHNVKVPSDNGTQYPAVYLTTALQDDRVVPAHAMKFAAELQHTIGTLSQQTNPLLVRIEDGAGHGSGKPTSKQIEEKVDVFSFLVKSIGLQLSE